MAFAPAPKRLTLLLSFLAGYVDSCTFLALFGLFVAQVTGSFVLTGTRLVTHESVGLVKILAIPAFFVACIATTVVVRMITRHGRSALATTLALEAALLTGLLVTWLAGAPWSGPNAPPVILASLFGLSAMGVQSALVRLNIKGAPSTNVMTTNTTQLAIEATELVMSWRAWRAAPGDAQLAAEHAQVRDRFNGVWPVVLGFFTGTIAGGLAYLRLDLWCILAPIAIAIGLAIWTREQG